MILAAACVFTIVDGGKIPKDEHTFFVDVDGEEEDISSVHRLQPVSPRGTLSMLNVRSVVLTPCEVGLKPLPSLIKYKKEADICVVLVVDHLDHFLKLRFSPR